MWRAAAVVACSVGVVGVGVAHLHPGAVLVQGEPAIVAWECGAKLALMKHGLLAECIASGTEVRLSVVVLAAVKGVGVASARSRAGPGPGPEQSR